MFPGAEFWKRSQDENADSGAETAESDCSRMSWCSSEFLTGPRQLQLQLQEQQLQQQQLQQQQLPPPHPMDLHLLANPGDSLLLQHTLDHLTHWLYPNLRVFHVSERASSFRSSAHICPLAGFPSLAVTFFLHEAYGEERILKVLDYFQHPPWQFHHTEGCGGTPVPPSSSSRSSSAVLLQPYLLPSRDFYSLSAGMPVWGVRPVHCGGEILRLTLYSGHDNYQDAVHFYQTVLQRDAEEQKTGFCWFTLHSEPGLCMQLAVKQLPLGVRVRPCTSAVLQFCVEEMGQLVALLPHPCSPISSTRWQTTDLDGNKVLFQVKPPAQPERPSTCAFPLAPPSMSPPGTRPQSSTQGRSFSPCSLATQGREIHMPHTEPLLEKFQGGAASLESGICSSFPSGSSCSSSQKSSSLLRPPSTRSLAHLLLEEDEEETNVDTGVPASVRPIARSASTELLLDPRSHEEAAHTGCLMLVEPSPGTHADLQSPSRRCASLAQNAEGGPNKAPGLRACPPAPGLRACPPAPGLRACPPAPGLRACPPAPGLRACPPAPGLRACSQAPGLENRTMAEHLSALLRYEAADEFFI